MLLCHFPLKLRFWMNPELSALNYDSRASPEHQILIILIIHPRSHYEPQVPLQDEAKYWVDHDLAVVPGMQCGPCKIHGLSFSNLAVGVCRSDLEDQDEISGANKLCMLLLFVLRWRDCSRILCKQSRIEIKNSSGPSRQYFGSVT